MSGLPPTAGQEYTRRLRRYSAVWAIIVVVVAIAAGLGGYYAGKGSSTTTTSSQVTITYYDDFALAEQQFMTGTLIPLFTSENPNIHVQYVNLDAESMVTSITSLVQGGDVGTTLIGEDNLVIGALIYSSYGNELMNLTSIASAIEPAAMIPSMAGIVSYETQAYGGTYFIPYRANTPLVWLNATALTAAGITAPPSTFSELYADAQTLGSNSIMFQGGAGDSTATEMFQWEVQFGGNPMVFNDAGDTAAMSYLYNLSHYMNPGYKQAYWNEYAGLAEGTYQILDYQWPYVYQLLTAGGSGVPAMSPSSIWISPGPNGTGAHAADHVIGGDVLAIPKGATHLPQLEAFAHFLLSPEAQFLLMNDTGNPAVNAAAYQNLAGENKVVDTAILAALQNPVFRPPVPWIETWVQDFYNDVFTPVVLEGHGLSEIVSDENAAHAALQSYLAANYGSSVANQYAAGDFGPLYVV